MKQLEDGTWVMNAGPCEEAFRKGFQHGAERIFEAVKAGVNHDALEAYLRGPLQEWRNDFETPAHPPEVWDT
ncbi:hypothetical protein [Roseobacter sp. HKCCA0434]|uniref:hypothetical protein n=1 Tax=Roseobacter sp. HKCCA0434 TaxID=3079297 RepID=UPI002905EFC9|nr:hypothetical protein [Roseobacter sp. HKCCA0434]